ncbi:MAG: hypothetical protein ACUVWY_04140 [Desulfosoma sp.]|uniref:hypothetical protein n=1 Tax=Desulfosoma sp. TaxID=2603217 RepID=UPI00404B1E03
MAHAHELSIFEVMPWKRIREWLCGFLLWKRRTARCVLAADAVPTDRLIEEAF